MRTVLGRGGAREEVGSTVDQTKGQEENVVPTGVAVGEGLEGDLHRHVSPGRLRARDWQGELTGEAGTFRRVRA